MHGNGLSGIGERTRALRGRVDIVSPARGGTCIEIVVPLAPVAPAAATAPLPVATAESGA